MNIQYLVQPEIQIGRLISSWMDSDPKPNRVILVSAFNSYQTLLRFRPSIIQLRQHGSQVKVILGIDLGGTSKEALEEVLAWEVDSLIVKNRCTGYTFHPKIYLFEWNTQANIMVGSSNMTEGGFFKNYEGDVLITYDLPDDHLSYSEAQKDLARFLTPKGPTVQRLSKELLSRLVDRGDLLLEKELIKTKNRVRRTALRTPTVEESPFGMEVIPPPPPMPASVLNSLVNQIRSRQRPRTRRESEVPTTEVEIAPTAFYMTLPKMRGNIPGEPRIPLEARDLAQEFWGWPDEYSKDVGPRGSGRQYWNWKPIWRIWDSETPDQVYEEEVRVYMYVDSSDYRFYSRRLLNLGADKGDIVRITRVAEPPVEFECVLARKGTETFNQWEEYCTEPVRNSTRRYGYA